MGDKSFRKGFNAAGKGRAALLTLLHCLVEARPSVQVIFLIRLLCGAVLAISQRHEIAPGRLLADLATWESAIACIYLFNGVTDMNEDRINKSGRPIARGDLKPATALRITILLGAFALAGGLLLGGAYSWLTPAILVLGYLYSGPPFCLKRRSGGTGLIVVIAGLLTYYAGYAGSGGSIQGKTVIMFSLAMSLWMGLVGATTKDFSDAEGDAASGRQTGVVRYGELRIRVLASAAALALGAGFLVTAASSAVVLIWPAAVTAAGAGAVTVLALTRLSTGGRHQLRRPYRAFMVTQYLAHLSLLGALSI
jgi:4-hydroxybenzoate polyprenyltransferase